MTQELHQHGGSQLAIHADQSFWTDNQRAALAQLGVGNASGADLAVFFHQAQRTGLDPFARQIYMIERQGKWTIQTGIDGFRLIARRTVDRTGETFGQKPDLWCGKDGQWRDVWLESTPPAAAKHTVIRNGQEFTAVALFDSYAGRKRDGKLNSMWASQGPHMIAKCAEALALRKAFPQDLSGLYTADEMAQADNPAPRPAVTHQQVQEPAQVSGRDWLAELNQVGTLQGSRDLYVECARSGEMTDELKAEFITVGSVLAETEKNQSVADVATGEIIEETV